MTTFSSFGAASAHELPADILEHLPVADAAARSNLQKTERAAGPVLRGIERQAAQALTPSTAPKQRLIRLRFLAGEWTRAFAPRSACRKGCSHCCHIDVAVPREEAQLIAKATGAVLHEPATLSNALEASGRGDYFGTACTFLLAGKCSIYAHRPLACRTLVNLDDDERLCELRPGVEVPVPYADATALQGAFVQATHKQDWADLREWFPEGLS